MYISPKKRGDIPGSFLPERVSEGHLLLMVSVSDLTLFHNLAMDTGRLDRM